MGKLFNKKESPVMRQGSFDVFGPTNRPQVPLTIPDEDYLWDAPTQPERPWENGQWTEEQLREDYAPNPIPHKGWDYPTEPNPRPPRMEDSFIEDLTSEPESSQKPSQGWSGPQYPVSKLDAFQKMLSTSQSGQKSTTRKSVSSKRSKPAKQMTIKESFKKAKKSSKKKSSKEIDISDDIPKKILGERYIAYNVIGDGNCLYRAINYGIMKTETLEDADNLRRSSVSWTISNSGLRTFELYVNGHFDQVNATTYAALMSKSTTYATDFEADMVGKMLQIKIEIVSPHGLLTLGDPSARKTIRIAHIKNNHFVYVL